MTWVSVGVTAVGAAGSMAASDAQQDGARSAIGAQQNQSLQTRQDQRPFTALGTLGAANLQSYLGLGTRPTGQNQTYDQVAAPILQKYAQLTNNGGTGKFADLSDELRRQAYNEAEQAWAAQQNQSPDDFGSLNRKFSSSDLQADPVFQASYQSGLDEGTKGVNRLAGATGMRNSGATLKALTRFAGDYTNQKAGESYNRYNADQTNLFNRLAAITGMGQTSANTVASSGANAANNIGNAMMGAGNARAAGYIGAANAATGAANIYNQNSMLNSNNGYLSDLRSASNQYGWN